MTERSNEETDLAEPRVCFADRCAEPYHRLSHTVQIAARTNRTRRRPRPRQSHDVAKALHVEAVTSRTLDGVTPLFVKNCTLSREPEVTTVAELL